MVSPMPSPPSERASGRSPCVKRSKTRGSNSGAMPMPLSRTRMIACPRRGGDQLDPAAGLGVLGGVGQQVDDDLLEPVGSASIASRSGSIVTWSSWFRSSISGRTTTPPTEERRQVDRWGRSWILPRVTRETSSRSSTRRVSC